MTRMIALLRGVNVSGQRKVPMKDLRALAEAEGFSHVATYIQSGNVVLTTERDAPSVTAALESAIERHFGFRVDVIVRTAAQWEGYASGAPFPDAREARPKHLLLALAREPLEPGLAEALAARAKDGERVSVVGDALWIDYAAGVARSKLTPALLDRCAGSPVTARNWNTVLELLSMAREG